MYAKSFFLGKILAAQYVVDASSFVVGENYNIFDWLLPFHACAVTDGA